MQNNIVELQNKIDYQFQDANFLKEALTIVKS